MLCLNELWGEKREVRTLITWLDDKLLALAKKIILIAAFFGISRKKLIFGWIITAYSMIISGISIDYLKNHSIGCSLALILWLISFGGNFLHAHFNYREDELLPEVVKPQWRIIRVIPILMFLVGGFLLIPSGKGNYLTGLGYILSPCFYYYLLMCQNPRNKVTLKSLVKSLFAKLKTAFNPNPAPTFEPVSE